MYKRKQSLDQKTFFKSVKSIISDKKEFAQTIGGILGTSKSGAYKKINGTSKLSYDEIIKICTSMDISFDQIAHGQSRVRNAYPFFSEALKFKPESIHHYWANILDHLEKIRELPGLGAIYLTNEIPFFYYLQFPNLLHFKMFVWDRTSWHILPYNRSYDKDVFTKEKDLKVIVKELVKFYNSHTNTEIWNPDMLRITMMQLNYFIKSRIFENPDDIRQIIKDIEKMLRHMSKVCESGMKSAFGSRQETYPVHVYLNELSINSEIIYIHSDVYRILYNKYDSPNYIRSDDDRVCNHMADWLDDIINQSTLISKRGQRDRDLFFKNLFSEFDHFRKSVEGMIESLY